MMDSDAPTTRWRPRSLVNTTPSVVHVRGDKRVALLKEHSHPPVTFCAGGRPDRSAARRPAAPHRLHASSRDVLLGEPAHLRALFARAPIAACPLTRLSLPVRGAPSGRGEPPASPTPASERTTTAVDYCKMSLTPTASRRQQETSSDYVFIALLLTQGCALDGGRDGGSFIRRALGFITLLSGARGAFLVVPNGPLAEEAQGRLRACRFSRTSAVCAC